MNPYAQPQTGKVPGKLSSHPTPIEVGTRKGDCVKHRRYAVHEAKSNICGEYTAPASSELHRVLTIQSIALDIVCLTLCYAQIRLKMWLVADDATVTD